MSFPQALELGAWVATVAAIVTASVFLSRPAPACASYPCAPIPCTPGGAECITGCVCVGTDGGVGVCVGG